MRLGKALVFLSLCLFVLTVVTSSARAAETSDEIRRLLNEAPPLASFPDSPGMIWKSHVGFRMLADGSLEKTTRWYVLSGGNLPLRWREWGLAVPESGSIEVLESGIFDPVSGRLVAPLLPETPELAGVKALRLRAPELGDEKLICVAFREVVPARYNVDGFLWTAFDLPCWEQTITVEVPADADFAWKGEGVPSPEREEKNGVLRYSWSLVNTAPMGKPAVTVPARPHLLFSLTRGLKPALADLDKRASGLSCQMPRRLGHYLREKATLKQVRRFLAALEAPERHSTELPGHFIRQGAAAAEAPSWTDWERTLLAARWLASAGVDVRTFWLPRVPLGEDDPAASMVWARPVLEIKPKGSSAFYWSAGDNRSAGAEVFSLFGRSLYRLEEGKVVRAFIPSGEVEEHRLILDWDLTLAETGAMEGILTLHIMGGWLELLGDPATGLTALGNLVDMPALPQFSPGHPEIEASSETARFRIPVTLNAGIPSGAGALLLRLPSATFPALRIDREKAADGLSLRFPFVVDQRYNIKLPEGYRLVAEPRLGSRETGQVRFEEELADRSKGTRLEGSFRMVVTARELDPGQARQFAEIAARTGQWGAITVPLKK